MVGRQGQGTPLKFLFAFSGPRPTIAFHPDHRADEQDVDRDDGEGHRSDNGNWLWSFNLVEEGGSTKPVSPDRFLLPTLAAKAGIMPMEPGSLIMERKVLRGIKEPAEPLASQSEDRPRT